ncbi:MULTISPECIES: DNA polymerase III subunit delta' [Prochlorococcus]|uniref:ATPase involved in DNA replication n=1 Tax=Prochlorococcus marinus (strain SARG / CCMP1375 / SS120) TaxID=167539 RepID=Q7VE62_PROMA|nr:MULTISPECIES: DNA polymerase III subunit delta' [Prochlorococcus]AAP99197.1 ATPase involved in DNA replication [Prochlorococcus marinus subsp. marinus str. CCMP1375]KGG11535.1 DNA polymerasee III delta prime subunit [Prochlorococcus marinus str. LG]KGG18511.1 DNA polymerasee III delta prime subunit [Prochlorococcus marinus str. SS2]KGG22784.1 DNA polymerasee III delta prime subunit [Prochlorococcus marinus str. SS35]KGG32661.1 DNA polymerasee III delta prime subunit [Prochlorococcus marinus
MKDLKELFKEFKYQKLAIELLSSSLEQGRVAPTYLFKGPKGVLQKEIAFRFLEGIADQSINSKNIRNRLISGNHPDLYLIEPTYLMQGNLIKQSDAKNESFKNHIEPQIRVEQIKDLKVFLNKKPVESTLSMALLEDVDTLNESASNALLKTIEEPTSSVLILISSRPERLLDTIKSRCQIIPFKPFENDLLNEILIKTNIKKTLTNMHKELFYLSNGSPYLLKQNLEIIDAIPESIWFKVERLPIKALDALLLAKEITEKLTAEQQIWLINWMQQYYWIKKTNSIIIKRLEQLKLHLKSYVNQKIAWEIALIDLI